MRQLPKWLADPLGPLSIPPAYLPKLLPWLWRFWRAGRRDRYEASLAAQAGADEARRSRMDGADGTAPARGGMLREDGSLELYESEAEFEASLPGWAARDRFGIALPACRRRRARRLSARPVAALHRAAPSCPAGRRSADPKLLGKAIWAYAEATGRRVRARRRRRSPLPQASAIAVQLSRRAHDHGTAGWSSPPAPGRICWRSSFGDRMPLETERGYNTTLPKTAFDVKRQLIFSGHGFVITPLETGLRVGGAVELGGLAAAAEFRRARRRCWKRRRRFLPGLDPSGGREWMGYRPSLPDSLPVIGRRAATPQRLLRLRPRPSRPDPGRRDGAAWSATWFSGKPAAIDLTPFSPQRF